MAERPLHRQPGWDMHDHGPELTKPAEDRLATGTRVTGEVVCHHHYGLGLYITTEDHYGHVNITHIRPGRIRGPEDFPPIGSTVEGTVVGYAGQDAQLRLVLYIPPEPSPSVRCEVIRWVSDDPWPGWVEARLVDATGRAWPFFDKPPIFTDRSLRPSSKFPTDGALRCRLIGYSTIGDEIAIKIETIDAVSTDETRQFIVRPDQVTEC